MKQFQHNLECFLHSSLKEITQIFILIINLLSWLAILRMFEKFPFTLFMLWKSSSRQNFPCSMRKMTKPKCTSLCAYPERFFGIIGIDWEIKYYSYLQLNHYQKCPSKNTIYRRLCILPFSFPKTFHIATYPLPPAK